MVEERATEGRLEEPVGDDVVGGALGVQVAVDRQRLGAVVTHGQPDRVRPGDVAVLHATVELVLLLVEPVDQVAGAAAGVTLAPWAHRWAARARRLRARGVHRVDVAVDGEGSVGEVTAESRRAGRRPVRGVGVGAPPGQRRAGEVDVVLEQAAVGRPVLRHLRSRLGCGLRQSVDALAVDLPPLAVQVVERVVLLVDHNQVLVAAGKCGRLAFRRRSHGGYAGGQRHHCQNGDCQNGGDARARQGPDLAHGVLPRPSGGPG